MKRKEKGGKVREAKMRKEEVGTGTPPKGGTADVVVKSLFHSFYSIL